MAVLSNPVDSQNIVDRYADYVVATANAGIVWGSNAEPFAEIGAGTWGGTIAGKAIGISGNTIGAVGTVIDASNIYNTLVAETNTYTRIRNLRAVRFVTGAGGNTGTEPTEGIVYDLTRVAHLNATYAQSVGTVTSTGITTGTVINTANLEAFFTNLRTEYNTLRAVTATVQINVCHASCHSSCHASRGRR